MIANPFPFHTHTSIPFENAVKINLSFSPTFEGWGRRSGYQTVNHFNGFPLARPFQAMPL
jgi:hypothetical protein